MKSLAILLVALTPVPDGPSDCIKATKDYNAVLSGVMNALKIYEQCVTASLGRSQCVDEFDELDITQQGFETVTENFAKACPLGSSALYESNPPR